MPTRFNTGTDLKPTTPVLEPVNENPSGQPQNNSAVTGQVIGSVIDQLADQSGKGEIGLAKYSVAALDVVDQVTQYKKEKERILASISTADPKDREGVNKYLDELDRLKKGQVQGTLTFADANLRINNLTKQAINAYPGQTTKILQIRNGQVQDITSISGDKEIDPDTQAINELSKSARLNGWDITSQIAYNHAIATSESQKRTLEAKLRAGSASEEDVAQVVYGQVGTLFSKFAGDMGNAVNRADFQGVKWLPELLIARGQIEQQTRQTLTQTQVDKGFKFSPGFVDNTIKTALEPIDQLVEIAKAVDNPKQKAETAKQLLEIQRSGDLLKLRELLGPMAMLANSTQDIMMYLNDITRYREGILHGQRPVYDTLAKQGDVKTRLLLGVIDGKDFETNLAEAIRATAEGNVIPPSTMPEEHKMKVQVSLNAALNPRTSKDQSENMLTTLAGQTDAFEAWDARKDVRDRTLLFKSTQDALRTNATRQNSSRVRQLTPADVEEIKYDPSNATQPFKLAPTRETITPAARAAIGNTVSIPQYYVHPDAHTLVDQMNRQYRVLSSFTPTNQMHEWAKSTLTDLAVSRDPDYVPPVKTAPEPAATPTAPAAPVEATIAKNGDVQFGRFSVARTTYSIRDSQTNRELSPPALERLRTALQGTPAGEQLEAALDFSYSTEESDNGTSN